MKRFLKWFGIVVGALLVLVLLACCCAYLWMRFWGPYDEKQAIREILAKGEKMHLEELLPPRPSDDRNFYGDPMWLELADLVPVNREYDGISYETLQPRLATEKLQINQWKTLLSQEEQEAFRKIQSNDGSKERKHAIRQILTCWNRDKTHAVKADEAGTLMCLLSPAEQFMEKVRDLSKRPEAVFPNRYIGFYTPLPHITPILDASTLLEADARAKLALGHTESAAEDIQALIRISLLMRWHPSWIQFMVRSAVASTAVRAINEGVIQHQWSPHELSDFELGLSSMNLPEDISWSLRTERAMMFPTDVSKPVAIALPDMPKFFMSPLYLRYSSGHGHRCSQKFIETLDRYDRSEGLNETTVRHLHMPWGERCLYPYAESCKQNIHNLIERASEIQTQINQTVIACALERYRIARGSYPASLDALAPEYIGKLPSSPNTGKPMNYSLKSDGTFLLWSPGWNLKSLGGKPGEFKGDGDIVWGVPLPTKEQP